MKKTKKKTRKKRLLGKRDDYYVEPRSESELVGGLDEDFVDAWSKLKIFELSLGEQRIYTSAKAIMFARRICHAFVRPKRSYLELCFFLDRPLRSPQLKTQERSKKKFVHTFRLVHPDQVEDPLTNWLREAFEQAV